MQEKPFSGYLTRSVIQLAADYGVNIEALYVTIGFEPAVLNTHG